METYICKVCSKIIEWTGYHKGFSKSKCASCYANSSRLRKKQKIVAYLGGKCSMCGYNKSIHSLECHHLDPSIKSFSLSGAHCRSWKKIKIELDKCILLCSNCHREVEYGIVSPAPVGLVDPVTLIR